MSYLLKSRHYYYSTYALMYIRKFENFGQNSFYRKISNSIFMTQKTQSYYYITGQWTYRMGWVWNITDPKPCQLTHPTVVNMLPGEVIFPPLGEVWVKIFLPF